MTKIVLALFSKKTLLFLLLTSVAAFIASLWHRYAYIDDCWFGEQAYWLAKEGVVKTKSIQAGLGWEEHLLVYHKLNIWIGALIVNTLGWSVYYFKGFTLLAYAASVFVLFRWMKRQPDIFSPQALLIIILLIISNPLMFIYGFTYRPEILVMLTGLGSFIALRKVCLDKESSPYLTVLSALLAAAAFLTHLNGIIFSVAAFIMLLIFRRYKEVLIFSLSAFLLSLVYFLDLLPEGNFHLFLSQIRNWPDAVGGNYVTDQSFITAMFKKLGQEHQRFFWSDKVSAFSTMFILAIISSFRTLKSKHSFILIYTLLLILLLNLLGSQIAERYLIYYLPLMAIVIGLGINNLIEQRKPVWLGIFAILLLAQLGVVAKHCVEIIKKNDDFTAFHAEVAKNLPPDSKKLMAPYRFIFNEIDHQPLLTYHSLEYSEVKQNQKFTGGQALLYCKNKGIDCIIIDKGLENDREKYRWFVTAVKGQDSLYRVYRVVNGYTILTCR
jgi:hypothetical protein